MSIRASRLQSDDLMEPDGLNDWTTLNHRSQEDAHPTSRHEIDFIEIVRLKRKG